MKWLFYVYVLMRCGWAFVFRFRFVYTLFNPLNDFRPQNNNSFQSFPPIIRMKFYGRQHMYSWNESKMKRNRSYSITPLSRLLYGNVVVNVDIDFRSCRCICVYETSPWNLHKTSIAIPHGEWRAANAMAYGANISKMRLLVGCFSYLLRASIRKT